MATERHKGQRKAQRRVSSLIVLFCSSFLPNPFFGGAAHGQFIAPDFSSARSFSGQFIIHDQRSSAAHPRTVNLETNRNFVRLEPALLTVSCERLKQVLHVINPGGRCHGSTEL